MGRRLLKKAIDIIEDILDVPTDCGADYIEDVCDSCPHMSTEEVGHPGGGSGSVDKRTCDVGHWKEDF